MIDWPEGVVNLTREVDLVHSPDDEDESGKGYYLSRYKPRGRSKLYATSQEALTDFRGGKVEWELD
jgi:hypothetical protein